jgi:hypothetical protein
MDSNESKTLSINFGGVSWIDDEANPFINYLIVVT